MTPKDKKHENHLSEQVGDKVRRKLKAKRQENRSVWSGLGLFGLVGWSIVVPTLSGAALGIWLDVHYKQSFSWTLSLLIMGLLTGCLLAWNWVQREHKDINQEDDD